MKKNTQELLAAITFFSDKNWSPATSTNYSIKESDHILISRSGVDKSTFSDADLIRINEQGEIFKEDQKPGIKSSAETDIHLYLYKKYPWAKCVLHTHSIAGTLLSHHFLNKEKLEFEGLELLKGFRGNTTHLLKEIIPIVPNSQDMQDITRDLQKFDPNSFHGFLIAGHGLYTWGENVFETKRQIETYEFLFELRLKELSLWRS